MMQSKVKKEAIGMPAQTIPSGTILKFNGVPVQLTADTEVECGTSLTELIAPFDCIAVCAPGELQDCSDTRMFAANEPSSAKTTTNEECKMSVTFFVQAGTEVRVTCDQGGIHVETHPVVLADASDLPLDSVDD